MCSSNGNPLNLVEQDVIAGAAAKHRGSRALMGGDLLLAAFGETGRDPGGPIERCERS